MTTPGPWPPPPPNQPPPFQPPALPPWQSTGAPYGSGWGPQDATTPAGRGQPLSSYAPLPYTQQPGSRGRWRGQWLILALVVLLVAAGGLAYWSYRYGEAKQTEAQIRETISEFALASDTADAKKLASMMCEAEASQFVDGFEANDDPPIPADNIKARPVNIGTITVSGDDATVDVTRPPGPSVIFKLKRAGGTWKLCNPE